MKQIGKRVLAMALTLLMVMGIIPAVIFTASASLTASGIANTHAKTNLSGSADRWFNPETWFDSIIFPGVHEYVPDPAPVERLIRDLEA